MLISIMIRKMRMMRIVIIINISRFKSQSIYFLLDMKFYFIIHSFICLNEDFILVFKFGTSRLANLGTFCTLQRLALDPAAKSHATNILKQNSFGKKEILKIGTMVCQKCLLVCSVYYDRANLEP